MNNANEPDIRAYIGATGSGKGVSIREHLDRSKPTRLLVWDPLNEYATYAKRETTLAGLAKTLKARTFKVAYWPGADVRTYEDKFAVFCRAAFAAGDLTMLVEELADVTSPARAPMEWRRCTTQGRHRGLRIVAASQRPAQVDKQFLGGCTYIRCFTLRYPADRQAMAGAMDVPLQDVASLATVKDAKGTVITYLERDFRGGKATRGTLRPGARP